MKYKIQRPIRPQYNERRISNTSRDEASSETRTITQEPQVRRRRRENEEERGKNRREFNSIITTTKTYALRDQSQIGYESRGTDRIISSVRTTRYERREKERIRIYIYIISVTEKQKQK